MRMGMRRKRRGGVGIGEGEEIGGEGKRRGGVGEGE